MAQGSGVALSCGVGHRRGSDSAWFWLWGRPAAIQPLAWELPYPVGAALKKKKKKKKNRKFQTRIFVSIRSTKE